MNLIPRSLAIISSLPFLLKGLNSSDSQGFHHEVLYILNFWVLIGLSVLDYFVGGIARQLYRSSS